MDERPRSKGRSYDARLAKALGRTIKVLRTDQGLDRKELARLAGISYSYLTEIENGAKPASNTILGPIAETLGLQLNELIAEAEARLQAEDAQGDLWDAGNPAMRSDESPDVPLEAGRRDAVAPPSARRSRAMQPWSATSDRADHSRLDLPASTSTREVLRELGALLPLLGPDDQRRVLDMARRLTR
jgi:transcriptional regulator with XRE-family HTH domain